MEQEKILSFPVELKVVSQTVIFGAVSGLAFFVPFLLGHPQWLVGTAVNAFLFLAAIFLPKKYFLPIIILPGLGVLARGIIFGPFTPFLVYFLPFIWLGNLALIFIFSHLIKFLPAKYAVLKKIGIAVFVSAVVKFFILFLFANIYFKFSIVPAVFVQAMGLNQLATALAGGLLALLIFKIYGEFISGSRGIT